MTCWILALERVHFNWDIQVKMAFVELTVDSLMPQAVDYLERCF